MRLWMPFAWLARYSAPPPQPRSPNRTTRAAFCSAQASAGRLRETGADADLAALTTNPFNPDEINCVGGVTSPQGSTLRVNGFLDQAFCAQPGQWA